MLRFMRLGDGMLARFNGMGVASPAGLATVLAYDDGPGSIVPEAPQSRYFRMARGETILFVDGGPPPALDLAGEAHAGCLSFEMSVGTRLLFVNGGVPGPADSDWRAVSRATASHNTLCLADKSSSKLVQHRHLEALLGSAPIRLPEHVEVSVRETNENHELNAAHDGYVGRFGLHHRRRLVLEGSGSRLTGVDRLEPSRGRLHLSPNVPFAIHFHLHPNVMCRRGSDVGVVTLDPGNGARWRFLAQGAEVSMEESTYFAGSAGPRSALQIVLRGKTTGEAEVRWIIETDE